MNKFTNCLVQGKKYEIETLKYIDCDSYNFSQGNFKDWDIEIIKDNVKTYYEVKSEKNAGKYGNIAIEYECNGKASGVTSTTCNIWCHYAIMNDGSYILYFIPIEDLRALISEKKYHRNIIGCGDGKRSSIYLFRMKDLAKWIKS